MIQQGTQGELRMHWKILTPFSHSTDVGWIPAHIVSEKHSFEVVPAGYFHDRSRRNSGGHAWKDFFQHAFRAWSGRTKPGAGPVGYITSFPQLPLCLALIKRLTGSKAPIVAWTFNMGKTYDGMKGRLARFALPAVDVFVVHSTAEIDAYSRWLNIPRDRFMFVPLGIKFDPPAAIGEDPQKFVLSMGSANRDYECLIKALEPFQYRTIIVAGQHAVEKLSIPDWVEVRSGLTQEECHRLAQRATVNVVPLKDREAASGQVTFLETMIMGKPIIASDCIGTRDYIKDGENGCLVPVGDSGRLGEAISRLWQDAALRERLGKAAKADATKSSSFEAQSSIMLAVLEQSAGRA
jgi:glycosyltransferase involved in cell wall biosynthesis